MMVIALALKILVIYDVFIVIMRALFDYNNFSTLLAMVLSSICTGVIIGEMMFCKMRDSGNEKSEALEYFEKHEFNKRSCMNYILTERCERMDYIIYACVMLVLLVLIYTVRMITTNWMYIFEALIVFVTVLISSIVCELIEKYRLCDSWVNPDEDDV